MLPLRVRRNFALKVYRASIAKPPGVWIHGGAWRAGSRAKPPALFLTWPLHRQRRYRFTQEAIFPAPVHRPKLPSVRCRRRWLRCDSRERAGGHPESMFVSLGAVGGEGTRRRAGPLRSSSSVQAVVDFFSASLTPMSKFPSKIDHDAGRVFAGISNSSVAWCSRTRKKRSAPESDQYVGSDDPARSPSSMATDPLVPPNQSELLEPRSKKAGVPIHSSTCRRAGHGEDRPDSGMPGGYAR